MPDPATDTGSSGSYDASFGAMAADASRATKAYADVTREKVAAEGATERQMTQRGEEDRLRSVEAFKNEGIKPDELKPWNAEIEHKKFESDPLQGFASSGAVFAMIASAFTKAPMLSAIEGMAGALNGIKEGDEAKYNRAFESYKQNVATAKAKHEIEHQAYTDALALGTHDLALSNAKLRAEASRFGDKQILALADNGMVKEIYDAIAARNKSMESAANLSETMTLQGMKKDVLKKQFAQIDAAEGPPGPDGQPTPIPAAAKAALKLRQIETVMGKMGTPQQLGMHALISEHPEWPIEKILEEAEKHNILRQPFGGGGAKGQENKIVEERAKQIQAEAREKGQDIPLTTAIGQARTEAKADSKTGAAMRERMIDTRAKELLQGDPDLSVSEANSKARREIAIESSAPSGNQIDKLRSKVDQSDNVIKKSEKILAFLDKYKFGTGVGGKLMRGEEIAANLAGGSTQTDRVQFRRDVLDVQKILPEIMADHNGKVLKSDQEKIDAVVAGLAAGDTGPNTKRAYRELIEDVKKRKKDFSARITTGFDPEKSSSGADEGETPPPTTDKPGASNWLDAYPKK